MINFAPSKIEMEKTDKRTDILMAAEQLFSTHGFDGTSTRHIAKVSCANMAMINYYFGSKEGVFLEIMERRVAGFRSELDAIINEPISSDQKLIKVIAQYAARVFDNVSFHKIMHRELSLTQRPEVYQKVKNVMATNRKVIEDIVEEGIANGTFRAVDVKMTIAGIMGTIQFIVTSPERVSEIADFDIHNEAHKNALHTRLITHLQDVFLTYLTPKK